MTNVELLEVQRKLQRQHGIPPAPAAPDPAAVAAGMINTMAAKAEKNRHQETEYLAADGLLRCKICGGPRQCITPGVPELGIQPRKVGCWCSCPNEFDKFRDQEKRWANESKRGECFKGFEDFKYWTFDKDDGQGPELMQAAREYAKQFPKYLKEGRGLLFYGDVDGGKSVAAACIANAVIEQGYRAKMTSLTMEVDRLWAAEDKAAYIRSLCSCDLLILDDLGVERKTEYMQEMVYKIINARVVQGGPMIITTNLTRQELGSPAEIEYKRIYGRILENCLAVHVASVGRRMQAAAVNKNEMRRQLGIGGVKD